jgi:hypothetical protein
MGVPGHDLAKARVRQRLTVCGAAGIVPVIAGFGRVRVVPLIEVAVSTASSLASRQAVVVVVEVPVVAGFPWIEYAVSASGLAVPVTITVAVAVAIPIAVSITRRVAVSGHRGAVGWTLRLVVLLAPPHCYTK